MITQEFLKEHFRYEDGKLILKKKWFPKQNKLGTKLGGINCGSGYEVCTIKSIPYKIHRLIFLYHHGYLPKMVDHIDRNPLNNRIENLRQSTSSQNNINVGPKKNNTSGYKGVHIHSYGTKRIYWASRIMYNYKIFHLGIFKTPEEAAKAYDKKAKELFGEFAYLNFS